VFKIKEVIQETNDFKNEEQKLPKSIVKEEKIESQSSHMSSSSHKPTNNSTKKNNFKPHNYGDTDFTKYHNQSKDILFITKQLQQVNIFRIY